MHRSAQPSLDEQIHAAEGNEDDGAVYEEAEKAAHCSLSLHCLGLGARTDSRRMEGRRINGGPAAQVATTADRVYLQRLGVFAVVVLDGRTAAVLTFEGSRVGQIPTEACAGNFQMRQSLDRRLGIGAGASETHARKAMPLADVLAATGLYACAHRLGLRLRSPALGFEQPLSLGPDSLYAVIARPGRQCLDAGKGLARDAGSARKGCFVDGRDERG